MTNFTPPTKAELKQRYNIPDDHFDVLVKDDLPEPSLLHKLGQWLEPVLWCHGVPTFILKNKFGRIIALLFLSHWGPTAVEKISDSYAMIQSVYNELNIPDMPEEQKYKYAIVTESPITIRESQLIANTGSFPVNSGVYPYPT
jgi:hypothetical protein